jgi:hypothetical protein
MRSSLAAITTAIAALTLASAAQAGGSQSAPSKYSQNANRTVASAVVSTRPTAIREFSSSSARSGRGAPGR